MQCSYKQSFAFYWEIKTPWQIQPWLATELEPNRKLFPDHLPFILPGALVGAGSLWPEKTRKRPFQSLLFRQRQHVAIAYKCLFDQIRHGSQVASIPKQIHSDFPRVGLAIYRTFIACGTFAHSHSWYHAWIPRMVERSTKIV